MLNLLVFVLLTSVFACTNSVESCNGNGVCNRDKTACICSQFYTTHEPINGTECNYKRKKQQIAFTMAVVPCFGWLGSAYFYIDQKVLGIMQLLTTLALITTSITHCYKKIPEEHEILIYHERDVVFIKTQKVLVAMVILWWLITSFMFAGNVYKDGNGIELASW